ncbi:MAG TPA: DegT/DnrJ/EryC1/StrS family aminotransferase [Acidobacteriaceae bacterium]|jgi:dTDP-4-amino-4,6-dideoxygalactose transaminase|nr:DegT/DnrJ/EryC1/StrS family aminotransferase [Acidobacteriaceae bacterium]
MADFSRQYGQIREEILAAIERVCASQHFILGEEVRQFETQAASVCGVGHAIGCASGTDALWLALTAAQIGPGDRVLTTPFSFFATVSSILRCGARPVLVDIDPLTYNLNPAATGKSLQDGQNASIRAILPVDLYGQCADWDAFGALQKEHGCLLLEDAAQAFGATWHGRPAGSLGDLAAFSFYPTKNLSAYGDAGMVTTNDARLAERVSMLRVHGMRRRYYHDEVGWNCRLDTLQAAVLLVKLRYIEGWNQQRRNRAANYDQLFHKHGLVEPGPYPQHGVVLPFIDPRGTHVFHQYVIRVTRRDALQAFLSEQKIGSEIYYPIPLHLQQCLQYLGYKHGDFPESERAAQEVLALPMFPELTGAEQERVVAAIAGLLG